VGVALLAFLSRGSKVVVGVRRERVPMALAKGAVLALGAACEEVIWRWFVLGGLAGVVGLAPALAVSTAGFALSHRGRKAVLVHLLTGGAFGGLFALTGSLLSAITAHVTYNLLILLIRESGRSPPRRITRARARAAGSPATEDTVPVRLHDVSKRYGQIEALRRVSLEVGPGEVVALLGPNGAGKTTAMRILVGLRRPDQGYALLFGRDPRDHDGRRLIGTTPQETGFPTTVSVEEIVKFAGAHYSGAVPASVLLRRFGLAHLARRQTGGLSGGERRRLAVALALVGNPRAIFLDEPTTGLDVESRHELWEAVRAYADEGGTVLLTTHYLDEAEALASRVTVLLDGRVAREGTVSEIKGAAGLRKVRLTAGALPNLPEAESAVRDTGAWTIHTNDTDAVLRRLVEHGIWLGDVEVFPVSLEEAFLHLIRRSESDSP